MVLCWPNHFGEAVGWRIAGAEVQELRLGLDPCGWPCCARSEVVEELVQEPDHAILRALAVN